MKTLRFLATLVAIAMAAVSCDTKQPNEEEPQPEVKAPVIVLSQDAVELGSAGNAVTLNYTIENPAEGVTLGASHDADWLTVNTSTAGIIALSASKNSSTEPRTTSVTLSYEGAESLSLEVSQKGAEGLTFELNFSDVAHSNFILQILPSDNTKLYYFSTMERTAFESFESEDALFESEMARVQQMADDAWLSFSEMLASLTCKGEKWQAVNQLQPETDYVSFAVGITSSGTRTSSFSHNYVTTTKEPTIDMDFTIDVSEYRHTMKVTITPARKKEAYIWDVLTKSEVETVMAANGCENPEDAYGYIMAERVSAAKAEGTSIESYYSSIIKKGTQRNQPYECAPSTDYYVMAAALNKSCVPGAVTLVEYTSEPMATPGSSDNEIAVSLSNAAATYVQVSGEASNMDPYVVVVLPTEVCASLDDSALFDHIFATFTTEEIESNTYEGGFTGIYNGLTPSTAYTAVAFGYEDGVMTTTYVARSESLTTLAE